jgi:MerR family copper efflux transcriptional regulator
MGCRMVAVEGNLMGKLTIGKVAGKAGVGVETIPFYEREGLISQPPKPGGGGYRNLPG